MLNYELLIMNYELSTAKLVALVVGLVLIACVAWCFLAYRKQYGIARKLGKSVDFCLRRNDELGESCKNYKIQVAVLEKAKTEAVSQRDAVGEECKKKNLLLDQQNRHIETLNGQVAERDNALRILDQQLKELRDLQRKAS